MQGIIKRIQIIWLALLTIAAISCKKDHDNDNKPVTEPGYNGRIQFVLQDNFNFSDASNFLRYGGLLDTLGHPGPFTFLAPTNDALAVAGSGTYAYYYTPGRIREILLYHILRGKVSFRQLPLGDTALVTMGGGAVHVFRYLNGTDTVTTINGMTPGTLDVAATNGLMQVMPQLMNPETYPTIRDFIHNEPLLTLFAAAMQRSGLENTLLAAKEPYTVIAPSNAAFQQSVGKWPDMDLTTIGGIMAADPGKLATLMKYHILPGRLFTGDLFRMSATAPDGLTTVNGGKIKISGSPLYFNNIFFQGAGSPSTSAIYQVSGYDPSQNFANRPCTNGVLHVINGILIP
ncbi:fasciclin domain-containing protein [Chitinophaga agrisoli]|nr:fasciclin domain-containing protein [Chitinophaga agrisoli]